MDEEAFNTSMRKFLKTVGVNSQREIEQAVRAALDAGRLVPGAQLPVRMTLEIPELQLSTRFDGTLPLG